MKIIDIDGTRAYQFESFDSSVVEHRLFTRLGGVSKGIWSSLNLAGTVGDEKVAVAQNHEIMFKAFGAPLSTRFDVWQVHGTQIHFAEAPRPPEQKHKPGDAIFTDKPGITLTMRFADCIPLLFHDPVKKVIGIVHAGWLGTALQISRVAVEAIGKRYGSKASDLIVGIGPAICGNCYEVGEDVIRRFEKYWRKDYHPFFKKIKESWFLDISNANEYILRQAGVKQIEQSHICTAENLNEWYSYRKEKGLTGRFGVVFALKDSKADGKDDK
jgi:YfiH family protein